MTRYRRTRTSKRPIRKDRVAVAVIVLVVLVLLPVLLVRTGCSRRDDDSLVIVGENEDGDVLGFDDPRLPGVGRSDGSSDVQTPTDVVPNGRLDEEILTHTVADGETLADVAFALGVSEASLRASNRLYGSEPLQPGQVLVASRDGVLHLIKSGQTLTDIAVTYAVPKETIAAANGISVDDRIFAGERLLIPTTGSTVWANVVRLARGVPSRFIWPMEGEVVSEFGWRVHPVLDVRHHHDGIDIDVPEGRMVYAAAPGEVLFYGEQPGYGNVLILEHTDGFYTMYGHLSGSLVEAGRFVEAGQGVALSGNTGISSGPHLHFEVRNGAFPVDPMRYLP